MSNPGYPPLRGAYRVTLSPAACAADLGDGSERGEYVSQDYIFRLLGRPHRSINLMYCYYPLDRGWPRRASEVFPRSSNFAWAYPYDDYFPYGGGPKGNLKNNPFPQMRDVRRHGQDVTLTLALDCRTPVSHLEHIARELKPFGRLRLRINHECDGSWFAFNRRYDRRTISDFFIKFGRIVKRIAPAIRIICCFGSINWKTKEVIFLDELAPMLEFADIWSIDKYLSLHYGWPFDICEPAWKKEGWKHEGVDLVWREMELVYAAFAKRSGQKKPLEICEFNSDGDVAGSEVQADELEEFYDRVRTRRPPYLKGMTYYQFRDRGRLGLEQEDPNNREIGIPQPFLQRYREIIRYPWFTPGEIWSRLPAPARLGLEWRAADDSDGVGWRIRLKGKPRFLELCLPNKANLVIRAGETWLYKKPGEDWVEITHSYRKRGPGTLSLAVFSPPEDGADTRAATRTVLGRAPLLRVRYPA